MAEEGKLRGWGRFIGGAIVGVIVMAIVAFSADWIVTTGTMNNNVHQARIDTFAAICAERSVVAWQGQGANSMACPAGITRIVKRW